jgi:hypothetical protein
MTAPQESQAQEQKPSDKELNFRALQAKYERQLQESNAEKERYKQELEQKARLPYKDNDDEDDEPYVAQKKLDKRLAQFGQNTQSEIQKAMEVAKHAAKQELRQEMWLESNSDFYDVLQHAEKFAQKAPQLAESILKMPEGFERQKLVYQNIKTLGIDKPEQKQATIQDKIDANKRSPYYQPSGVGAAPYAQVGDYSEGGQKQAYEKMQQLKKQLRI